MRKQKSVFLLSLFLFEKEVPHAEQVEINQLAYCAAATPLRDNALQKDIHHIKWHFNTTRFQSTNCNHC